MTTITLHPINHNFDNDSNSPIEVWELSPDHLSWLFRGEYRFLRKEGVSRRGARWHVHRMLSMIANPIGWTAELRTDDDELDSYHLNGYCQDDRL